MAARVAVQEPVARVTGYFDGRCVVAPLNTAALLPVGMALFANAAPQPATDRDAVIALLSDDALATSFQTLGQYRAHLIGVLKSKE